MSFSEWKTYKLGKVCSKIGSGATPRGGQEAYLDSGEYALIRSQNVLDFTFSYNGLAYINEEQASKLNNVALEKEDILLNITGDSVARVCQVPNQLLPARVNQHVAIIRPQKEILDSFFLKYYLLNPNFKKLLLNISSVGATRNAITKGMIEDLEISAPDLKTQQRIASILSCLDDAIELNQQNNKTLEEMAKAIFKEWFVDFNFPNATGKFQETEIGKIPVGWKVATFEDVFDADRGLSYKGAGLAESDATPMHNLNSVLEGGGYKTIGIKYYNGEYKDKHIVNSGEVIVANTEQGHKYLLIGYPAIVPQFYGEHGIFSHHIYRLRPKPNCYLSPDFIYHLLLQTQVRDQVVGFANGTTVNMLKIEGLQKPKFAMPPKELAEKFGAIAKANRLQAEQNIEENQTLINLRDTLLPTLMKGEININL